MQRRPRRVGGGGRGRLLGLAAASLVVVTCNAGRGVQVAGKRLLDQVAAYLAVAVCSDGRGVQVAGGASAVPGGILPCVQPRPRRAGGEGRALACLVAAYLVVAACSHGRGVQVAGSASAGPGESPLEVCRRRGGGRVLTCLMSFSTCCL